jgi:cyclin A
MAVQRSKLQLVGTACMFIAAKYEEIYPPDVSEFVYITDDTYNKRQVLLPSYLYRYLLVIRYR